MIHFGVWASSEAVFWDSWINAGIATAPYVLAPQYAPFIQTTAGSWHGIIVKTPAVLDGNGVEITPAVMVPGWHCNVRVFGALEASFKAGCPTEGTIWERTHAAQAFGLSLQPADPETGFPAGMRSPSGVVYADASAFTSPSNLWA